MPRIAWGEGATFDRGLALHLRLLASARVTTPTAAPSIHLSLCAEALDIFGSLQNMTTSLFRCMIEHIRDSKTRLAGIIVGTIRGNGKARHQQ
jgi:hypothetical protein